VPGIVFFATKELEDLRDFYLDRIGAELWRDQGRCLIFEKNGFRFGFCEKPEEAETCGVLTFLFASREEVNDAYRQLEDIARTKPVSREPEFQIYQFYGEDPEGRTLEFQTFLAPAN